MKRSLQEISSAISGNTMATSAAIIKPATIFLHRSQSGSDFAAMTLLYLAFAGRSRSSSTSSSDSDGYAHYESSEHVDENDNAMQRPASPAECLEPFHNKKQKGCFKEFVLDCGALDADWKAIIKPLPLPPKLPRLPAGAKAARRVSKNL